MERLSCTPRYIWLKKRAAPLFVALIMLAIPGTVFWHVLQRPPHPLNSLDITIVALMFLVLPLGIAGYALWFFVFTAKLFMDEVYLDGDTLVLRNRDKVAHVPLADVLDASVKPSIYDDYDRTVVLKLRNSRFGKKIMFSAPRRGYLPSTSTQELIQRIRAARITVS